MGPQLAFLTLKPTINLGAENLGFLHKTFNYMVSSAQATLYASAGYMPVFTVFLFTLSYYILN